MKYRTPITDRTLTDVEDKTDKGYFNLLDWERIYENAWMTTTMLNTELGTAAVFNLLAYPTMSTLPSFSVFNTLIANILAARTAAISKGLPAAALAGISVSSWGGGLNAAAPDYADVNEWENTIDRVRESVNAALEYRVYCGVSAAGQPRFYQHRWREYPDWTPDDVSPVRRPRTGQAAAGRTMLQQNNFRRY